MSTRYVWSKWNRDSTEYWAYSSTIEQSNYTAKCLGGWTDYTITDGKFYTAGTYI